MTLGDYVCLEVADNSCGMGPKTLRKAFEPFFTTKEVGKGSGLGLSMVYGFAKQSGGHATIESEVEVGTRVRIFLPRSANQSILSQRETTAPSPFGNGERILVVEDEAEMHALAQRMLSGLGYQVTAVADGGTALAALAKATHYALLLSDILLGESKTGLDLAARIRSLGPSIAVVLMSGYPAGADGAPLAAFT